MSSRFSTLSRLIAGAAALAALSLSASAVAGQVKFAAEGHAQNPVWSLDGKNIAFEVNSYGGDGISLHFASVNGAVAQEGKPVKLPGASGPYSSSAVVVNPTWHPQGISVFEGSNSGGQFRLYFAQPGGAQAAEMLQSSMAPGDLTFPTIAPNGNLMGYVSDQSGSGDVRTWDRSTNKIAQVSNSGTAEMFPQFNKSGDKVLYTRKQNSAEAIYLNSPTGSSESSVVSKRGDQTRPTFAGNTSTVLYFSSQRGAEGEWDLYAIDQSGSGEKLLAQNVKLPVRARPAVSPDGKYVAFVYADPTKADAVQVVDMASGSVKTIKTNFTACDEPAIGMQDGRYVLAYTALPAADSDWRFLYLEDITNNL